MQARSKPSLPGRVRSPCRQGQCPIRDKRETPGETLHRFGAASSPRSNAEFDYWCLPGVFGAACPRVSVTALLAPLPDERNYRTRFLKHDSPHRPKNGRCRLTPAVALAKLQRKPGKPCQSQQWSRIPLSASSVHQVLLFAVPATLPRLSPLGRQKRCMPANSDRSFYALRRGLTSPPLRLFRLKANGRRSSY